MKNISCQAGIGFSGKKTGFENHYCLWMAAIQRRGLIGNEGIVSTKVCGIDSDRKVSIFNQ
jgi:hypothetical protein